MLDLSVCKFLEEFQASRSAYNWSKKSEHKVGKEFLICKLVSRANVYTVRADHLYYFPEKNKRG